MHMLLVLLHTIATILFNNSIYILYIHARSIIILLLLLIYNFCYYYYRLYHTHAIDRSRIDGIQMVYSIRYIYRSKKCPKREKIIPKTIPDPSSSYYCYYRYSN